MQIFTTGKDCLHPLSERIRGEKVVAHKKGKKWAEDLVKTTDKASKLESAVDREIVEADGKDLAFITVKITDKDGLMVPRTNNLIEFSLEGPGEIVATDNGDPTNMVSFASKQREAFNGLCLAIVRSKAGIPGTIIVTAKSSGLKDIRMNIQSK